MTRQIVSVWFPYIATDLIIRRLPVWRDKSLALFSESGSRLVVTAVNPTARLEGATVGMTLADTQVVVPDLISLPSQLDSQILGLKAIARLMNRVTPMAAIVGNDALFLDMTGGTHLFGGELTFLKKLTQWLSKLGFSVRLALAETPGAAWAMAHYGNTCTIIKKGELSSALAPLPIAALRISPETSVKLRRVGITHIKDLTALPRKALVRRFGIQIAERLDQALGAVPEPISPEKLKPSLSVNLNFAEPISEQAALETALDRLLNKLIFRLTNSDLGAMLLDLSIKRVDGGHKALSVGIAFPSREKTRLARLFKEKLGTIDPGFGIETMTLSAPRTGPLDNRQGDALGADAVSDSLTKLIDTFGNRLGFNAIQRFKPIESWRPGHDFQTVTMKSDTVANDDWPTPPGPRPLTLLSKPIRIGAKVTTNHLEAPTILLRGSLQRQVRYAEGPERILPEWWEENSNCPSPRDYWKIEDEAGERLWIYREKNVWYLHGFFA